MPSQSKHVFFKDFVFAVDENVYEPAEDSFLFAENLDVKAGEQVLDMGTGCGILGILIAEKASQVVTIDINPYALRCTIKNAESNNVSNKMFFLQGDLFASLSEMAMFDVILFNAPYMPTDENEGNSWIGRAWAGGATGREIIDRFIPDAAKHLKSAGRIFLMQSTLSRVDKTLFKFEEHGLKAEVIAEAAFPFFETITLIKAAKRSYKRHELIFASCSVT